MTLKRILNNWRLEGALLIGLVLAAGIVSAVPIYTSGSLQRSLFAEWVQQSARRPPLGLMITHTNDLLRERVSPDQIEALTRYLDEQLPRALGQEAYASSRAASFGIYQVRPANPDRPNPPTPFFNLRTIDNLQELARVVDGRWYAPRGDGVVEVVVDENTLEGSNLIVGERYVYQYQPRGTDVREDVVIEIVGLIEPLPERLTSEHWIYSPPFERVFLAHPQVFYGDLFSRRGMILSAFDWYYVFDYRKVRVDQLDELVASLTQIEARAGQIVPFTRFWYSPVSLFRFFIQRSQGITNFLTALSVPIVGMVLYYVTLIAGLTVEKRRNEIAVLHSRGAGRLQVAGSFFLEWALLGIVAALAGPYVGLGISRAMGASAGFLTFVGREALPVAVTDDAFRYSLYTAALAVAAAMLPAVRAARHSIVSFKLELARGSGRPGWQKYFLDLFFVAAAAFGYRVLSMQSSSAAQGSEGLIDPMLLFVPLLFLLGTGLFALRVYPWLMSGALWITSKLPGIVVHLTVRQLGRSSAQYTPLLLLLILTVSLGIYTASAARTLDRNFEDAIAYRIGADAVLEEQWRMMVPAGVDDPEAETEVLIYEPPFYVHEELPGVASAARVLTVQAGVRSGSRYLGEANLMGIVPHEFGRTAWFRDDLAPFHFYDLLNLLTRHREGFLANPAFLQNSGLQVGDFVTFTFRNQPIEGYIAGVVEYWPTLDPTQRPFFVGNLEYIQEVIALEPYRVWLDLEGAGHLPEIVERLREHGIWVIDIDSAENELVEGRRQPHRMGFFGILSIGFIVSSVITVLGFMLYTFLSMRSRLLQFGVLRAVGLSLRQLIALLALEQVLSVGMGLAAGTGLGIAATRIFLPFLRASGETGSVPPFLIVTDPADISRIFSVLGSLLIAAVIGLAFILIRMKLHQAIKLGEEA